MHMRTSVSFVYDIEEVTHVMYFLTSWEHDKQNETRPQHNNKSLRFIVYTNYPEYIPNQNKPM